MIRYFTFISLLFLCSFVYSQNELRQITFINMLPNTEYLVTVNLDGRKHWAKIPQAKAGDNMVSFAVYEWTEEIVVSVTPAWESEADVLTPKGAYISEMPCVQYYSSHVWKIYPSCWEKSCMTFYLNNEKMPRP